MNRFRKKPVVVEAEQFLPELNRWPTGVEADDRSPTGFSIDTLEGRALNVSPGDWIIVGVKGEKYPCKPDIFDATYEQV